MSADETVVILVNTSPLAARKVIVQGGGYAEHQIESVRCYGKEQAVNASSFAVELAPGCGARLTLKMQRYVNQPTLAFPWV